MILMVNGTHHNEGHQKAEIVQKINHYEGISLVKNGFCAWHACGAVMTARFHCKCQNHYSHFLCIVDCFCFGI
jgi:hypothetical protein